MDYTVHWILQARILELIGFPFSLPNPGIEPRSPSLQEDSLPTEPQGKPKNTGMGSLSLLQWIFPTQESNWGILYCRKILYQLSYQASPRNDPQTGEQFYQRSSHTFAKVLGPTTDFPTWGSSKRTEHLQGNRFLEGTTKSFVYQDPGERSSDPIKRRS